MTRMFGGLQKIFLPSVASIKGATHLPPSPLKYIENLQIIGTICSEMNDKEVGRLHKIYLPSVAPIKGGTHLPFL